MGETAVTKSPISRRPTGWRDSDDSLDAMCHVHTAYTRVSMYVYIYAVFHPFVRRPSGASSHRRYPYALFMRDKRAL